ncbi:efflux RND transporter periplasmic adaptor subunit [Sulfurimonas sp. HSL-1716]|uniref:efflux RND transporter periplasmic adaptor subunit n=1 Tax=Hydrocurvibacter sulfurireducens TaxID=3131937 RepID=UPI0031F731C6
MKNWKKLLTITVLMMAGSALFYFKVYIPKTTYRIVNPKKGYLRVQVFGIGTVDAKDIYQIGAQTGGKITDILTDQGRWIKKGALIATVDPVDLPLQLEEAKASLAKARSESIALREETRSLKAQKELIKITYDRYEKLYKQRYAAKAEYDKAAADLQSINAQIAASRARANSSDAEIKRAKRNIKAMEVRLSRYHIYAPISGYVVSKNVQAAQNVLPTQSIVKIADPKSVWIKAYVDERISADIKAGQKALITLRSQEDKKFEGKVARIAAISDAVTQEREVDVSFDDLPIPFYLNEQAQVSITTKVLKDLFLVDTALLVKKNKKSGVWVVKGSTAHFQILEIIAESNGFAGIKSGIDETTKIIVSDPKKKALSEGIKVRL